MSGNPTHLLRLTEFTGSTLHIVQLHIISIYEGCVVTGSNRIVRSSSSSIRQQRRPMRGQVLFSFNAEAAAAVEVY
jgi:hypothetical protein